MNKYAKIIGRVLVCAFMLFAQSSSVTYFTRLRIASSPSTTTNTLTDGLIAKMYGGRRLIEGKYRRLGL